MKQAIAASSLFSALVAASPQWAGAPTAWESWASSNGVTGWPTASSQWSSWASAHSLPTATSAWSSWASAHGWKAGPGGSYATDNAAWTSARSVFESWTSANTITSLPTAASEWTSFTSEYPLPTALTNSGWASAVSQWDGDAGSGWQGGNEGPFGPGGLGSSGWGAGRLASTGAWTSGPWTSWWGTSACPASTWSGWTDGSWSTTAPWTSWTACAATTTTSSVYTTTTTDSDGGQITDVTTSFGVRLAEATDSLTGTSGSGAMPTNFAFAGSAAGVIGVVAGAILL